jgi:hypothetical protein
MKNLSIAIVCFFAACTCTTGQECSRYYPMKEGTSFQYTSYDKKGKEQGTINYRITEASGSGDSTSATMNMTYIDDKGKEVISSNYTLNCSENTVHIDYESLLSNDMMQQFDDMEMEVTGTDIELPNDLSVGQNLADANVNVKMSMGGINMNMNVETVNRKVEKKESVTTPAGSFDCYVISSETKSKMVIGNNTFPNLLWLAEGVGMVKQETYNKNGKLMGSMLLTQFSE